MQVPTSLDLRVNATTPAQIQTLAAELERRHRTAHDLIIPARQFKAVVGDRADQLLGQDVGIDVPSVGGALTRYGLNRNGHAQTAAKLNIPKAYYDRMLGSAPELLAENVNTWAGREGGNWMLRMLDGVVRANLSDRYRSLDNNDLFFATYQQAKANGAEISRVSLTDDRFEMRLIAPGAATEIDYRRDHGQAKGGGIGTSIFIPGAYVSNSETGSGKLKVSPFILDLVCTNGMVGEQAFGQVHVGGRQEAGYVSAETREAKDKSIWLEIRDLISAVFDRERFRSLVAELSGTMSQSLDAPIEAVDTVVKEFGMTDEDKQAILNELISPSHDRDPGRTMFGLISAVTERAKAYADNDPERATDFEEAGMVLVKRGRTLLAQGTGR